MNDARRQRRIRIASELFYDLQRRYVGRPVTPTPSDRDVSIMSDLFEREQATFDEVRDAIVFVYQNPAGHYWADRLAGNVGSFANAYQAICDSLDRRIPGTPAKQVFRHAPAGTADHIAAGAAQPHQLIDKAHPPRAEHHRSGLDALRSAFDALESATSSPPAHAGVDHVQQEDTQP